MNNETTSIHEFDVNLICEYFLGMERQGPGSPEATRKALSFIDNLNEKSRIADLGRGTGGQTIVLTQRTPAQIQGIDLFPTSIDRLNVNANKLNFQGRAKGIAGSRESLPRLILHLAQSLDICPFLTAPHPFHSLKPANIPLFRPI
jgi:predicted RNA methylase